MKRIITSLVAVTMLTCASAQTASSLFMRSDSLEVSEIASPVGVIYNKVGHHGPAVENIASAFRLYFNDSGAIDAYCKRSGTMELMKYKWYPTAEQQENEGAGCDEYAVSKTIGLGGIALWDGTGEVSLVATKGRTGRVGKTDDGSFCEIIAYGVEYKGAMVDVAMRIDVHDGSRVADVTAWELNGRKLRFVTGLNYHDGADIHIARGRITVWGVHPPDVAKTPHALGSALWYKPSRFGRVERTEKVLRIVSRPCRTLHTSILSCSAMEPESGELAPGVPALGSETAFDAYVSGRHVSINADF